MAGGQVNTGSFLKGNQASDFEEFGKIPLLFQCITVHPSQDIDTWKQHRKCGSQEFQSIRLQEALQKRGFLKKVIRFFLFLYGFFSI